MIQYIDKAAVAAEIENRIKETESMQPKFDQFWAGQISAFKGVLKILDTIEVKEDKEMPTSGECVTISKERYQELLEYESVALWAFNVIIVESLPSIEDEKLKEISDDAKLKAVQAAFQEALKNKEDKE